MLEIFKERRSCRKFDAKEIEEELIGECIDAGLYAPSGMGQQNGIIIAVTNKELRNKLAVINAQIMGKESSFDPFYGAPVILLIASKGPTKELDGAAMIENIMLEAASLHLGSCWIHRAKEELEDEEVISLFRSYGVDLKEYTGIDHVALGYPLIKNYPEKKIKENRVYRIK